VLSLSSPEAEMFASRSFTRITSFTGVASMNPVDGACNANCSKTLMQMAMVLKAMHQAKYLLTFQDQQMVFCQQITMMASQSHLNTQMVEYTDGQNAIGSSLIRWNIGETQWLESSYAASGTGVVRIIDPDMNLNPESVDTFDVNVWSDTAAGGISLRVTETNEATGIFEGTVFFTTTDSSSGSRLAVSEGDTVTAEYEDNTLPDPYSTADELDITATTLIGTIVPPLERAPAANLKPVDAFGNSLSTVAVDQQIQLTADLHNGQDRDQKFAYLLQVQDQSGVTVALSWITGVLTPGQQLSPAVSWIPTQIGTYTATVFVWESVDNPTALSPPVKTEIVVNN